MLPAYVTWLVRGFTVQHDIDPILAADAYHERITESLLESRLENAPSCSAVVERYANGKVRVLRIAQLSREEPSRCIA